MGLYCLIPPSMGVIWWPLYITGLVQNMRSTYNMYDLYTYIYIYIYSKYSTYVVTRIYLSIYDIYVYIYIYTLKYIYTILHRSYIFVVWVLGAKTVWDNLSEKKMADNTIFGKRWIPFNGTGLEWIDFRSQLVQNSVKPVRPYRINCLNSSMEPFLSAKHWSS